MKRRWVLMAGAVGVAGAIWLATQWLGTAGSWTPPGPGRAVRGGESGALPPPVRRGEGVIGGESAPAAVRNYAVETRTRRGQRVQFFGERFDPLPQGRGYVQGALARVYLTERQYLEIRAEEGEIYAPENQPRSGQLKGQVRVSLYQWPGRKEGSGEGELVLRVDLEEANFDLELGQLDSGGNVRVAHEAFDFEGRGLAMTYNPARGRIDLLEVLQARELRIRGRGEKRGSAAKAEGAEGKAHQVAGGQFYRARVGPGVRIRHPQVEVEGESLEVLFSLSQRLEAEGAEKGGWSSGRKAEEEKVAETVVNWGGRLVVEPVEREEEVKELAGVEDVLVRVVGQPVCAQMADGGWVKAGRMEYLFSGGRLRVLGTEAEPMVLQLPGLGVLRSGAMVIDQVRGWGQVLGGGTLRGGAAGEAEGKMRREVGGGGTELWAAGLPEDLVVSWSERLELAFFVRAAGGAGDWGRLQGLAGATFCGQVRVEHPEMELSCRSLGVKLSRPEAGAAEEKGQKLEGVSAEGEVQLRVRAEGEEMVMKAERVEVAVKEGERGELQPRTLRAHGGVEAELKGQKMVAQEIDAELEGQARELERGGSRGLGGKGVRLKRLEGRGKVEVNVSEGEGREGVRVRGQRVVAEGERVEVWGSEAEPAQLERGEGKLVARRLMLDRERGRVEVPVAGVFLMTEPSEIEGERPRLAAVRWQEGMVLEMKEGRAVFRGGVVSSSEEVGRKGKISGREMEVKFARREEGEEGVGEVQEVEVRGDMELEVERFLGEGFRELGTRLTVQGRGLRWEEGEQRVWVGGPGRMLYEDYRPDRERGNPLGPERLGVVVPFAGGRGQTLFLWEKELVMEGLSRRMRMQEGVEMIHRPSGWEDVVEIRCGELDAEVEGAGRKAGLWRGGLGGVSDAAGEPEVKRAVAEGDVRIRGAGWMIWTDRARFDREKGQIVLEAQPGGLTRVLDVESNEAVTAEGFVWWLEKNRLEVVEPGPGRIPLR